MTLDAVLAMAARTMHAETYPRPNSSRACRVMVLVPKGFHWSCNAERFDSGPEEEHTESRGNTVRPGGMQLMGKECLTAPPPIGAGDSDDLTSERPFAGRSDRRKFRVWLCNLLKNNNNIKKKMNHVLK